MGVDDCAELVRNGDPDRFLSALTAPPEQRARLLVLYAFNLELARVPWISKEPMIAEMRLQFWRDIIDGIADGKPVPSHVVAGPLVELVRQQNLPCELLQTMIDERRFDIANEAHKETDGFHSYIMRTTGNLMGLAVKSLGGDDTALFVAQDFGHGVGVSAMLVAHAKLKAANKTSFPAGDPCEVIVEMTDAGLASIEIAEKQRHLLPNQCAPALRAGWMAKALLKQARNDPKIVLQGQLGFSEFSRKGRLLLKTLRGSW